ncbi:MAG TPA: hypothetical protein PLQ54_13710 [Armatimonadota bacterium]|nr:hypothetical protein [Armatimonadota bacterium]
MSKPVWRGLSCVLVLGAASAAISQTMTPTATPAAWRLAEVGTLRGFDVPECVVVDPATGSAYVSNIQTQPGMGWEDDGAAFLSRLRPGGALSTLHWNAAALEGKLNGPKGMCILGRGLYVADNTRVVRVSLTDGSVRPPIEPPGAQRLNDMATDGEAVYASDTATGNVFRIAVDGSTRVIQGPPMINGITFAGKRLFAVSWEPAGLWELDPSGKLPPRSLGLPGRFVHLDGIEVLEDGTFIISDFHGNAIYAVGPDGAEVSKLAEVGTPADIGIDRHRGLLFVPQFDHNQVVVYRIERD